MSNTNHNSTDKFIFDVIQRTPVWVAISGLLLLISLSSMIISTIKYQSPILLGIDFTGGTTIEYKFSTPQSELNSQNIQNNILTQVDANLAQGSIIQVSNEQLVILRSKELSTEHKDKLDNILLDNFGEFTIESVDTVSGTIGPELMRSGLLALFFAIAGILAFVGYRFKKEFAFCAIAALFHDVFIVLGLFSILGLIYQVEVNSLFLTACLTVLGFSVHDTIVVFDRVRENFRFQSKKNPVKSIINKSINQVWFRSFGTSITLLFVLAVLAIFGGDSTKIFAIAMFTGMLTGTYSSLFIAPVLLFRLNK